MSSQPFFVKVHHLWKSKINCIYRGRFAEAANFCNVFWTISQLGYTMPSCHVGNWRRRFYDAAVSHRLQGLSAIVICYHFMTVCNIFIQTSSSLYFWYHLTTFFPPRNDSVLIICKHRPWLSVRWNPTSSGGGKGWRACSSSSANNKCNQMRQRASTCQQQTRSLLVQSALDANIPHFHLANWYCHALEYLVLMSQFWFVSTIGWLFCAISTITPPIYRVFLFNWYPP